MDGYWKSSQAFKSWWSHQQTFPLGSDMNLGLTKKVKSSHPIIQVREKWCSRIWLLGDELRATLNLELSYRYINKLGRGVPSLYRTYNTKVKLLGLGLPLSCMLSLIIYMTFTKNLISFDLLLRFQWYLVQINCECMLYPLKLAKKVFDFFHFSDLVYFLRLH